jgi:anti-anti-sigma factor
MSIHLVSHSWEVTTDGLMVTLNQEDLVPHTDSNLIDDLFELFQESGQTNFLLDCDKVHHLPSIVFGKLIALDAKIRQVGWRLVLCNVDPHLYDSFKAGGLTDILDIRESGSVPSSTRHHEVIIRVLLADPDESLLASTCGFLSRNGFKVATAANGLDCLARLRDFKPDVLVLDPEIAWGQGDDVLALMQEEADVPSVPVLILSDTEPTVLEPAYSIQEHLAKPLAPELLANRIRWLYECAPPPGGYHSSGETVSRRGVGY